MREATAEEIQDAKYIITSPHTTNTKIKAIKKPTLIAVCAAVRISSNTILRSQSKAEIQKEVFDWVNELSIPMSVIWADLPVAHKT